MVGQSTLNSIQTLIHEIRTHYYIIVKLFWLLKYNKLYSLYIVTLFIVGKSTSFVIERQHGSDIAREVSVHTGNLVSNNARVQMN